MQNEMNQFMVEFMRLKQVYADTDIYFNEDDERELLTTKTSMDSIVYRIRELLGSAGKQKFFKIFNSGTCPFCLICDDTITGLSGKCRDCGYGERHGICSGDDPDNPDDYDKIYNMLRELEWLEDPDYLQRKDQFFKDLAKLNEKYQHLCPDPDRYGLV